MAFPLFLWCALISAYLILNGFKGGGKYLASGKAQQPRIALFPYCPYFVLYLYLYASVLEMQFFLCASTTRLIRSIQMLIKQPTTAPESSGVMTHTRACRGAGGEIGRGRLSTGVFASLRLLSCYMIEHDPVWHTCVACLPSRESTLWMPACRALA